MRLIMFEKAGQSALGARVGDHAVDLSASVPALPGSVQAMLDEGEPALERVRLALTDSDGLPVLDPQLIGYCPPIARPGKIICLGLNYADHAQEGGHKELPYPSFFMRSATSLVAHGKPIIRPRVSIELDYEAELVAVVGRRARHMSLDNALSAIAGYSIFNDASVRQYQMLTSQWTVGKNFDATGGFGPEFITADELPEGASGLHIESRLNGKVMQHSNTAKMMVDVRKAVVLLSECMTLEAGDLIVMGTPAGVGHARNPPVWMRDGDVCEVEIEGLGILRNPIQDEA